MDGNVELLAAFDADEGFVDLVRSDDRGLSFRAAEGWTLYQPGDDTLDGLEIIEVDEDFVPFADRAIAARSAPTRSDALKFMADDGEQPEEGDE